MSWIPWTEWECYAAGMFDGGPALKPDEGRALYAEFLRDIPRFRRSMGRVAAQWPRSCEHFLTKQHMNRIAWLGQAAMCIETGLSRVYRAGFKDMSADEQRAANAAAEGFLNEWLDAQASGGVHPNVGGSGLPRRDTGRGSFGADGGQPRAVVQGDLFGFAPQRHAVALAGVHAEEVAGLHGNQAAGD